MRECYDYYNNNQKKHGNFEISFKVCYRSLALSIADIFSRFCEEKSRSLQKSVTLSQNEDGRILIKKLRFTHKQQENEARGERYKNVFPIQ